MKKFIGDNFQFTNKLKTVVENLQGVRDRMGAKESNIFFLNITTKEDGTEAITYDQVLPTPYVAEFKTESQLLEAGIVEAGDLLLKGIPVSKYTQNQLTTSPDKTSGDTKQRHWIIVEHNIARAYDTVDIRRNLFSYDVHIRRFIAINDNEYHPGEQLITETGEPMCFEDGQLMRG